jgi:hypothetical protein
MPQKILLNHPIPPTLHRPIHQSNVPKCTQIGQLSPHPTTYIHFIQSAKRNKNDLMICDFSSFIIVQQKQSFIERAKLLWDESCTFT